MYFLRPVVFLFLLIVFAVTGRAQCVSAFPYSEDFENSYGNWTSGGAASDWVWGVPNKQNMLRAGNGNKCWVVGGLTGNHYNENEASWLQSPCFDFTGLSLPYLSFLINWDTEKGYDGAGLQYSTDNGNTWQTAGAYGEPSTGCTPDNWYTDANIKYAVQPAGWSGSSQSVGGNVAGWVKAYHSFPQLAGKSNVRFRFVFGAGSVKNNFGGVGIDDIYVGETVTGNQLTFTYTCTATARQASFFSYRSDCIDFRTLQWNFDDPASGAANILNNESGVHDFSGAGIYHITLSGTDAHGEPISSTQTIIIPDVKLTSKTPIACHGGTGILEASVTNTNALAHYFWVPDTTVQGNVAEVKAGWHQVQVTVEGGCMNYTDITLSEPDGLHHNIQTTPADCNDLNGTLTITESGGVAPYQYTWSAGISSTSSASNLSSGAYQIVVTDKNSCRDTATASIAKQASTLTHAVETILPDCGQQNGSIQIKTSGGNPDYAYQWTPNVSAAEMVSNIGSGSYSVVISDKVGCRDTALVTLGQKQVSVSLGGDTVVCEGQTVSLRATGSFTSYLWNDGSTAPVKEVNREGNYSLTIKTNGGCTASDTIHVFVGCGDLAFPSGFTPNGDGKNEDWGGRGGLSQISGYRLLVYNRYGNVVFQSTNPFQKWKGDTKGLKAAGTYVFIASYLYHGEKKTRHGTVTVLL